MADNTKKMVVISELGGRKYSNNVQPTKYEKPEERPKPSPPPPPPKKKS